MLFGIYAALLLHLATAIGIINKNQQQSARTHARWPARQRASARALTVARSKIPEMQWPGPVTGRAWGTKGIISWKCAGPSTMSSKGGAVELPF